MNEPVDDYRRVQLPLSRETARDLKLGEVVVLDGEIAATIGLPTHKRILEYIAAGEPLPLDLGGALFHLSICSEARDGGFDPLYVNPTTSTRFNAMLPSIIRTFDLHALSGKGGLGEDCVRAMRDTGCVYFSMVGGSSTLLSRGVKEILITAWDDLIMQFRLTRVRLEGFGPLTVAIDAHGNSLYENLSQTARERMPDILARLNAGRAAVR
jgi:fumarate hydratase subunit beta